MSDNAYRLQMQNGPEPGRSYELQGDSLTIGRYPLADIVIDDPDVGYRHALLTRQGATYRIADLGCDAGTYVNGRRVGAEPVALAPGDVILLGARLSAAFLSAGPVIIDQIMEQAADDAPPAEPPVEAENGESGAMVDEEPWATPALAPLAAEVRSPIHPEPLPAMPPPPPKRTNRLAWITAGCLLMLLACCCASSLFMYFIAGDWLLNLLRSL
ncbi:protein of unknown function [Candidatus Promineifilum breve]|uniref:FHA domain-containing protein n=1 Tax=Candidatus Promineifilum breve TaxID=1806508 RepID=A0A160SYX8_9CHLR|nr:FHA domain-containing protein [Candidatus Promineifilum breve]CUS02731.2 protein of unknown function [Candidatus Promineifilum breve]